MKLQHQTNSADDLCILCQMEEADPDREDGLCKVCADVADSYSSGEDSLELESE